MQMWVPKASMSFPGLELPTRLKHMLPVTTEAWHFSSSWKGLRREVDGACDKDTAWGPCQGYCRHGVGGSCRARIPKPQGFAIRSLMLDSWFIAFAVRSRALSSAARAGGLLKCQLRRGRMTQSTLQPQAWELCLYLPWETESLVTSHIVASTIFIFCKLNVRHFLF